MIEANPKKAAPPKNRPNCRSERLENTEDGASGVDIDCEGGIWDCPDPDARWKKVIGL
jgi:hypothetical protein